MTIPYKTAHRVVLDAIERSDQERCVFQPCEKGIAQLRIVDSKGAEVVAEYLYDSALFSPEQMRTITRENAGSRFGEKWTLILAAPKLKAFSSPSSGWKSLSASILRKEILRAGTWIHPSTKEEVTITPEDVFLLERETNRWIDNNNRVTFPETHDDLPSQNMGYWRRVEREGDSLYGYVEVLNETVLPKLGKTIQGVSAGILWGTKEDPILDSRGNSYQVVMYHVAATDREVISGTKGFEHPAFSGFSVGPEALTLQSFSFKEKSMETTTSTNTTSSTTTADPQLQTLSADLQRQREELQRVQMELSRERFKVIEERLSEAVKAGKLDQELADLLRPVLHLSGRTQKVMNLDREGKMSESEINFTDLFSAFLEKRKPMTALRSYTTVTETSTDLSADDAKKKADELYKRHREYLARYNPRQTSTPNNGGK